METKEKEREKANQQDTSSQMANDMNELSAATAGSMKKAEDLSIKAIDEEFLALIKAQEDKMKETFPDFDLKSEMEKNPLFAVMLSFNQPVLNVYLYFNPQVLRSVLEKDIMENIKIRNLKPEHTQGSYNESAFNVDNLTDKDMREIDNRVRRGERITF